MSNKIIKAIKNLNKTGFFYMYTANAFIMLAGILTQFYAASVLNVDELADVRIVQTYYIIFLILSLFGGNAYILKNCSGENFSIRREVLDLILGFSSITLFVTMSIVFTINYAVGMTDNKIINYYIYIYGFFCVGTTYTFLFTAYLQSGRKFKEIAKLNGVSKAFSVVFTVILTYIYQVEGFLFGVGLSACFTAILFAINVFITPEKINRQKVSMKHYYDITKFAVFVMLSSLCGTTVLQSIDILFIEKLIHDKHEIGLYAFSNLFFLALIQITISVQGVLIPKISAVKAFSKQWFSVLIQWQSNLLFLSILLAITCSVIAPLVVSFIYGAKYEGFETYLYYQALKYVIVSSFTLVSVSFVMSGKEKVSFIINVFCVPLYIVVTYLLVSYKGVMGGAYSQVINNLVLCFVYVLIFFLYFRRYNVGNKI